MDQWTRWTRWTDRLTRTALLLAAGLGALWLARRLAGPLMPVLLAFCVTEALRPLALRLSRRLGVSRRTGALLAAGFFYLGLLLLLVAAGTLLAGRGILLLQAAPRFFTEEVLPLLSRLGERAGALTRGLSPEWQAALQALAAAAAQALPGLLQSLSAAAARAAAGLLAGLPVALLGGVFTVVLSFYLAADYRRVTRFLRQNLPEPGLRLLREARAFGREVVGQLLRAYGALFLATFAEVAAGLWLLGVRSPLAAALAIALFDLLPLVGSGSVLVPWGLWAALDGRLPFAAGLWLLFGLIAGVRSILEPRLVGSRTGLHPLALITALFAGLRLFGAAGALLVPLGVLFLCFLNRRGVVRLFRPASE